MADWGGSGWAPLPCVANARSRSGEHSSWSAQPRILSAPLANLAAVDPRSVKYTQPQREAMAAAVEQPGVTGRDVVELAAAGQLTHPSGATLGPFTPTQSTVRAQARRARQRREGEAAHTKLSELPARDATERMRCALADKIQAELDRIDIEQAQGCPVSGEVLRQLARAVREFCWIPGPDEPRPRAPGAKRKWHTAGRENTRRPRRPDTPRVSGARQQRAPVARDHDPRVVRLAVERLLEWPPVK
jgi:hypothetical protein